jgi:hypothetical protein
LPHAIERYQVTMQLGIGKHAVTVKNQSLHTFRMTDDKWPAF